MTLAARSRPFAFALIAFALHAPASSAELPVAELGVGMHRIEAEVAATGPARQVGLMKRTTLAAHRGMMFVFPQPARHCMWMKNTLIPLSVAFLDDDGRILNIAQMEPHSEVSHCAAKPARYALEMNAGWFESRRIDAGEKIRGVDRLPQGR